jgi:hypothetical protein
LALWQRLLGTPVDTLHASSVSVMMYTSLVEGYSRGLVSRRGAIRLLAAVCRLARRRFGPNVEISLGAVGRGALATEPTYRGPEELAVDAAVARRAGIANLALFDLGGVLRRPPVEAWLDAFVG